MDGKIWIGVLVALAILITLVVTYLRENKRKAEEKIRSQCNEQDIVSAATKLTPKFANNEFVKFVSTYAAGRLEHKIHLESTIRYESYGAVDFAVSTSIWIYSDALATEDKTFYFSRYGLVNLSALAERRAVAMVIAEKVVNETKRSAEKYGMGGKRTKSKFSISYKGDCNGNVEATITYTRVEDDNPKDLKQW